MCVWNVRGGPPPLDRFSSQLRWNPVHDSRYLGLTGDGAQPRAPSNLSVSVRLLRRPVVERSVRSALVVEVHPPADPTPGLGAGGKLGQVDAFVSTSVKSTLVNWLPWSLLKISGGP